MSENVFLKNEIKKMIIDLQLPQIVLQLFNGNVIDKIANSHFLSDKYKEPYTLFEIPLEQLYVAYKVDRYVPFLACHQSKIFAYDKLTKGFIAYSIECFREDNLQRLTWDGLFVDEIIAWWEDEWSDEDIMHIGGLLKLKHTKQLIEDIALRDSTNESYLTWFDWNTALKKKINAFIE